MDKTPEFEQVLQLAQNLSANDRQRLIDALQKPTDTSTTTQRTNAEIIAWATETGIIGSWADQNIDDPVQWLEQQRKQRREKSQW